MCLLIFYGINVNVKMNKQSQAIKQNKIFVINLKGATILFNYECIDNFTLSKSIMLNLLVLHFAFKNVLKQTTC